MLSRIGYKRVGSRLRASVDGYLRAAVRRGILTSDGGMYALTARSGSDYTRDELVDRLCAAIGQSWTDREEAMRLVARHLGFQKAGSAFKQAMKSAINAAIRRSRVECDGNAIRKH
jgi:hypothetical protein